MHTWKWIIVGGLLGTALAIMPRLTAGPTDVPPKKYRSSVTGCEKKVSGTFCAQHPSGRSGKRYLTPFSRMTPFSRTQLRKNQKYRAAVQKLERWIADEVKVKQLPSLAVALVDDQQVVWTKAFGWADEQKTKPATTKTMYRVGSVSKPFTALLLMLLVEMGLIDLDTPVRTYLPEFAPKNPYGKKITLRQMLCHHSGLVREPPVGNYFDDAEPTLAETVASLNKTALVYEPETKLSYSNAALAVVGRVIEKVRKKAFAKVMKEKLLDRLGMTNSAFGQTKVQRPDAAFALMWTYHGREFAAPTFEFGMAPAGSLFSSADDMAKFLKFLFARGQGVNGRVLKNETLESMWKIQFSKKDKKDGFGLGFYVSDFKGKRRISHGGAVYGFSTQFAALPDDKLGVIVMAARDVSNAVTRHIADVSLQHLLAVRAGKPLPKIHRTRPVQRKLARRLVGQYRLKKKTFELVESNGKLFMIPYWVGFKAEVRRDDKGLIVDGRIAQGPRLQPKGDNVVYDKKVYQRLKTSKPQPTPQKWRQLIGEYGWDHNTLFILEKNGQLHALIEWTFLYPLEEVSPNVYKFPNFGLYHGEKLIFHRDKNGKGVKVIAANVDFPRRRILGEEETFTVKPVRPLAVLRQLALNAKPPRENGNFRKPNLVDLATLDKTIRFDIRYAGTNNFLETPFYTQAKAFMQRPAAEALIKVHRRLKKKGYGLLIHDAYRPWHVTKMFHDATPKKLHHFVADPQKGSRHNRGCAVDLTLYDLKTGKPVEMVAGFDEFTDRAYVDYMGGTSLQRWHRRQLRTALEDAGFTVYDAEWWHYDYRDWRRYPILNLTFEQLQKKGQAP